MVCLEAVPHVFLEKAVKSALAKAALLPADLSPMTGSGQRALACQEAMG